MANFAKKIKYAASPCSFVALLEIARKKGGKAIKFILYRYSMNEKPQMIECDSLKKAIKLFPYGSVPSEDELLGTTTKSLWKDTSRWLYQAGAGGAYEVFPKGSWVKIGRYKKRKRKKFIPRFGELGHILKLHKEALEKLEEKRCELEGGLLTYDDESGERMKLDDLFGCDIGVYVLIGYSESLKEKIGDYEGNDRLLLEILIEIIEEKKRIEEVKKEMRVKRSMANGKVCQER